MDKIYAGDDGTVIELETGTDLTDATGCTILVRRPDGSEDAWGASKSGTKIMRKTTAADLSAPGIYKLQARFVLPGWSGRGATAELRVYDPFE